MAQSQTVRSLFYRKEDLILPGQVRACPEILARTFHHQERYAASVVRQRAVTKGPGKDRAGGVAVRPRVVCQAPSRAEALDVFQREGVSGESDTAISSGPRGVRRRHLLTKADNTDR